MIQEKLNIIGNMKQGDKYQKNKKDLQGHGLNKVQHP